MNFRKLARRIVALAMPLLISPFVLREGNAATDVPERLSTYEMEGKIGDQIIGASMTIANHDEYVAGHYFYGRHLKDIPLTGRRVGDGLVLTEPGGGTFQLHFVTNEQTLHRPLDFYYSTGLQGQWVQNARSLPVVLGFTWEYDGPTRTRFYADVTRETDAVFEAKAQRFVRGVLENRRELAAGAIDYPLIVRHGRKKFVVVDQKMLLRRWQEVFTPSLKASLRRALPHEMFVRNGEAMIGNGEVWFSAKGAAIVQGE
jgi:hypothetical protein